MTSHGVYLVYLGVVKRISKYHYYDYNKKRNHAVSYIDKSKIISLINNLILK